jgi:hypothetical protein
MQDAWAGEEVGKDVRRVERPERELSDHEKIMRLVDAGITSSDASPANVVAVANKIFDQIGRKQVQWLAFLKVLEYVRLRIEERKHDRGSF